MRPEEVKTYRDIETCRAHAIKFFLELNILMESIRFAKRSVKEKLEILSSGIDDMPLKKLEVASHTHQIVNNSIPLRCFQTAERNTFGSNHHQAIIDFRSLNPEFEFYLYNAKMRDEYMYRYWGNHRVCQIYERSLFPVMRSDIFRYCVLYHFGGFYMDINNILVEPFKKFFSNQHLAVITYEQTWCQIPAPLMAVDRMLKPDRCAAQWGFGFAAGHPILAATIDNICFYQSAFQDKEFGAPCEAIRTFTGPGMFTYSVREVFSKSNLLNVSQVSTDFQSSLRYPKGTHLVYLDYPHYKQVSHSPILLS